MLFEQAGFGDELRYPLIHDFTRPIIVWNITSTCNLNCCHCYFDARQSKRETTFSLKEAADFILGLSKMSVPVIIFSGGEPLMSADIFWLGQFSKGMGIRTVLSTNGTLINQAMARKIKTAGFDYVGISIDGAPKTHDRIRGQRGAFKFALQGIRNCRKEGIKTGLRFTLMKQNYKDLRFIFDLVEKEEINRLCIYHLVYTGRARGAQDDISSTERREVLEFIWDKVNDFHRSGRKTEILTVNNHADGVWLYLRLKKEQPDLARKIFKLLSRNRGNGAGSALVAVDHLGNVFADQFLRSRVLGNIFKQPFSEIWQDESNLFLSDLRNRKAFIKGRCQTCRFFSLCNANSRQRALAVFGDLRAEDPGCYLTDSEIYGENPAYSSVSSIGINP
ncbi:MAG: radical SAM protein [Candidatus Omnitrophica bacterium]|nr:radical SAM protein [Candidatus Omnitrophota bacterium]